MQAQLPHLIVWSHVKRLVRYKDDRDIPLLLSSRAVSLPIPVLPPVMTATLPSKRMLLVQRGPWKKCGIFLAKSAVNVTWGLSHRPRTTARILQHRSWLGAPFPVSSLLFKAAKFHSPPWLNLCISVSYPDGRKMSHALLFTLPHWAPKVVSMLINIDLRSTVGQYNLTYYNLISNTNI